MSPAAPGFRSARARASSRPWSRSAQSSAPNPARRFGSARPSATSRPQSILRAGSSLARVVRCDVFLADLADFGAMNDVYGRFFPSDAPARVTVQAARLPKDARVEIAAIATVG